MKTKRNSLFQVSALAGMLGALALPAAEASTLLILDTFNSVNNTNPSTGHATTGRQSGTLAPSPITGDSGAITSARYAVTVSGAFSYLNADLKADLQDSDVIGFTISTQAAITNGTWISFYLTTHDGDERATSRMGFHVNLTGSVVVYNGTEAARVNANASNVILTDTLGTWSPTTLNLFELRAIKTDATAGTFGLFVNDVAIPGVQDLPYFLGSGNDTAGLVGRYNIGGGGLTTAATFDNWQAVTFSIPESSAALLGGLGALLLLLRRR